MNPWLIDYVLNLMPLIECFGIQFITGAICFDAFEKERERETVSNAELLVIKYV